MSTNSPFVDENGFEIPPDPSTEILPEVVDDELPSLVPVFEDIESEQTARELPEEFDEFGIEQALNPEIEVAPTPIGRTWVWDFNKGILSKIGNSVRRSSADEREVIQQWIRRCLITQRYAYQIYPDWYGIDYAPVLSSEYQGQMAATHLVNEIREALIQHDRISAVRDIEVSQQVDTLWVKMTVILDSGTALDVTQPLLEI